jgi:hypothetical protein
LTRFSEEKPKKVKCGSSVNGDGALRSNEVDGRRDGENVERRNDARWTCVARSEGGTDMRNDASNGQRRLVREKVPNLRGKILLLNTENSRGIFWRRMFNRKSRTWILDPGQLEDTIRDATDEGRFFDRFITTAPD